MSGSHGGFNFGDMISWLRDELTEDGYSISDTIEEYPHLPVDLFCTKGEGAAQEYCLVIVASIDEISKKFQKKLFFYQYFLSHHYKPSRLKIVLAVPASATVITTPFYADTEEEKKQDFYKVNGFGLWKIKDKHNIVKTYSPITLTDKIAKDFERLIAKKNNELMKKATEISYFVDKYIHDSVLGIVGVSPDEVEERYIDRTLLEKMLELEKISYREDLFDAISKHLSYKNNEYEFVSGVFSKLWKTQINVAYNNFLKTFDPALQHVFAETREGGRIYRDHYIHQFQVFLLGLYVIDKIYDDFVKKHNCKKPEISWLMISSFHDMAYPVQLYDEWSSKFFHKIFGVPKGIARIELKSKFVEQSFMNCTNCLIAKLCSKEELKGDWLAKKKELLRFFYEKITEAKNHCILSSMSLLKILREEYENKITIGDMDFEHICEDIIIPSALAIAIHAEEVWGGLRDKGKWQKRKTEVPLPVLRFEDDPLSFLLIFCDSIQEWGRPSQSQAAEKDRKRKRFYLRDLQYNPKRGFDVTIWTPDDLKTQKFFKTKKTELGEIETFLQQPSDMKFAVRLEDQNRKGEDFEMHGSPS